jgi:hypothetical protein
MAQLFVHPGRSKRGNPNWGRPAQPCPATATEFEVQVRQLGLRKQTYADSKELRTWCERTEIGATFRNGSLACGESR